MIWRNKILKYGKFIWHYSQHELSGFIVYYENYDFDYISMVFVNPESRGFSIGKHLVKKLMDKSDKVIFAHVHRKNLPSLRLFESLGWHFIDEPNNPSHVKVKCLDRHLD